MKTGRVPGAVFLGRAAGGAICSRCSRDIGLMYVIRIDGVEVTMGRRCASRTMGWPITRVEMEALSVIRVAEVNRRREVIRSEYPALAAEYDAYRADCAQAEIEREPGFMGRTVIASPRVNVFLTASTEDPWWGGRGHNAYSDWRDYIDAHI